jgi:hypothetical protein
LILPTQYGCDTTGCSAVRTELNHWRVVTNDQDGIHVRTWEQAVTRGCLGDSNTTHHCGQAHAIQQVSKLMEENNGQSE